MIMCHKRVATGHTAARPRRLLDSRREPDDGSESPPSTAGGAGSTEVQQPRQSALIGYGKPRPKRVGNMLPRRAIQTCDGGLIRSSLDAAVRIAGRTSHTVPGGRTSPLPSAETDRNGTVYVVWQDRRFEPGGTANDIIPNTSADGTTWSPVSGIRSIRSAATSTTSSAAWPSTAPPPGRTPRSP
jgi:hypothetical protein